MTPLPPLFGKTLDELIDITKEIGLPNFAAKQIADWLYKKDIGSIDDMSNLSKKGRELLKERYCLGLLAPLNEAISNDGTKKYLFGINGNKFIETAYIPETDRATVCLSTQAGCRMGCAFCLTGRQGFQGNLSAYDILNQFRSIPCHSSLTNVVYMGMGEPLDNLDAVMKSLSVLTSEWGYGWSPSRITVSTVGIIGKLERFLSETRCHLAVSLHSPFDEERANLMPVQRNNRLEDILKIIERYDFSGQRRVSFEYILLKGINDSPAHIRELARILNRIKCRINIIRFHNIPNSPYVSPDMETTIRFRDALSAKGIITTIRRSRGEDIGAACGLLSTLEQNRAKQ